MNEERPSNVQKEGVGLRSESSRVETNRGATARAAHGVGKVTPRVSDRLLRTESAIPVPITACDTPLRSNRRAPSPPREVLRKVAAVNVAADARAARCLSGATPGKV